MEDGAGFFCVANFRHLGEPPKKKRPDESNKGIFEIFKKKSLYLEEKNKLEVVRFRKGVVLGRQN
jgi:hypothetical protein